eukprot:9431703-Alexandrium_andersonii.AAC.1
MPLRTDRPVSTASSAPTSNCWSGYPRQATTLGRMGQRPLMLPTTLRRLVEAVTVGAVGPLIEPTLSAWQAA